MKPHAPEWNDAFDAALTEQANQPRNAARLWAKVPPRRYVCFYPMDKKRGEAVNWYVRVTRPLWPKLRPKSTFSFG